MTIESPRDRSVNWQHIDFLRGLAAVYVVINHTRGGLFIGGQRLLANGADVLDYAAVALLQGTAFGLQAVIVFFVLSGFAIAQSIEKSSSTALFYARRVLRIWPPYLLGCALAVSAAQVIGTQPGLDRFWTMIFYIDPGSPTSPQYWSLPYEVAFYAIAPLVAINAGRARAMFVIAAAGSLVLLAQAGVELNPSTSFLINFVTNGCLFFAAGILTWHHFDRIPRLTRPMLLLCCAILIALIWLARLRWGDTNVFSCLIAVPLAVILIRNADRIHVNFLNLGRFSYSIYVFHYALLALIVWALKHYWEITALQIRNPVIWVLAVPPILVGCIALYWCSEHWSNRAVKRLRSR